MIGFESAPEIINRGDDITARYLNDLRSGVLHGSTGISTDDLVNSVGRFGRKLFAPQRNWYNSDSSTCPAFGVFRTTGLKAVEGVTSSQMPLPNLPINGAQPNTYGSQYTHFLNGPVEILTTRFGTFQDDDKMMIAAYDTSDGTPAAGESWGPRTGTWLLKKNTGGFMIIGNLNTTQGWALVKRVPFIRFHGVTDAAIAKDASGTVSIFYGTGAGTDSTVNMSSVYNAFGDIAITKDCECVWEGDSAGVAWKIIQGEC